MNMKVVSMCLICAGDKDEHGCIASAGYTWSEVQKDCIRLWEKGVRMNAVDDAGKTLFLVFSPDSTQVELFFSEEGVSNEILDRRGLPAGGYAWNVEDDDTKNVRLEDGEWTVSQRGRLIYQEDAIMYLMWTRLPRKRLYLPLGNCFPKPDSLPKKGLLPIVTKRIAG